MDYSRIPDELKALRQWVCCWNGSKVPMQATRRKGASSTDPATWSTFEQAAGAVERGEYDHIGFVFADNGIVGIDIDAGFQDRLLTPLCADIVGRCRSYTERSRSGRGVHILLRGTLPFSGKNNLHGVEIYQSRRFFITTGEVLLFSEIVPAQEAIDYVVEKYFPESVRGPQNGKIGGRVIYTPEYTIEPHKLTVSYPDVVPGGRNLSLASLAGTMHNVGYTPEQILDNLRSVNKTACRPPLPDRELRSIVNSITRYRR